MAVILARAQNTALWSGHISFSRVKFISRRTAIDADLESALVKRYIPAALRAPGVFIVLFYRPSLCVPVTNQAFRLLSDSRAIGPPALISDCLKPSIKNKPAGFKPVLKLE